MGCGSSKDKLEGAEKPLDHWMEKIEIESLDNNFEKAGKIIETIEEKRKFIVDEINDIFGHSGAIAFKQRCLTKAFRCVVWKLGVDNDGKVSEIGFNLETHVFEGKKNSQSGNEAGNRLITYLKRVTDEMKVEDLSNCLNDVESIANDFSSNFDNYCKEVTEKFTSSPFTALKKVSVLKNNMSKITKAISVLKDLIERLKNLVGSAPQILSMLNPENMLKESDHVEKAYRHKFKHAVEIAWNLIEKSEERQGKSWNECLKEYSDKVKARNDEFAKFTKRN